MNEELIKEFKEKSGCNWVCDEKSIKDIAVWNPMYIEFLEEKIIKKDTYENSN